MLNRLTYFVCLLFAGATIFAMAPQTKKSTTKKSTKAMIIAGPKKNATCNFLGCGGGGQKCAEVSVHISAGVPGVAEGGADVTYYCYQQPRKSYKISKE